MKIVRANSNSATFDTKVETLKESAEYRITVIPHGTAKEELAFVQFEAELETGTIVQRASVQIAPQQK